MSGRAKSVVIVGNSGFARECHIMLRQMMRADAEISFRGFLSFEGYEADLKEQSENFIGVDDNYTFAPHEAAVIGIGDPTLRRKAFEKLRGKDVPFFTLIHPSSYVDDSTVLGEANIIGANCHISCDCSIGNANVLNGLVHIGHDTAVGHYNFIAPNVQVLGCVRMGDRNSVGATSVILPHARMGDGNIIAPLSAVYKGCGSGVYMAGSPAVKMANTKNPCGIYQDTGAVAKLRREP